MERICLIFIAFLFICFGLINKVESRHFSSSLLKGVAVLDNSNGVTGTVIFTQKANGPTTLTGRVSGLKPGLHGFHIHVILANATKGCLLAEPQKHFNPSGKDHGGPEDEERHSGDLGNLNVRQDGTATFEIVNDQISLRGPNSIIGKSFTIHAGSDDLGKGGEKLSKINGNAGPKIACGFISLKD